MRHRFALAAFATLCCLTDSPAGAHELRPGYLELREREPGNYDVLFKVPAQGDLRLDLEARLPETCGSGAVETRPVEGATTLRWQAHCDAGLAGRTIEIAGLPATRTDVLVRVEHLDGSSQTALLTPDAPAFAVSVRPRAVEVAATYFRLGVVHIGLGVDHLLFVLALLFLVGVTAGGSGGGWGRLVGTVTAFTLAHSVTLSAATLGWVHVAQAPVEAAIALSIVFVAAELLHARAGRPGLAVRRPWIVAFAFGLLHGLGFAGALREVGLPGHAIPLALAFFNLGVEAGQLLFLLAILATVVAFGAAARVLGRRATAGPVGPGPRNGIFALAGHLDRPSAFAIGVVASYWLFERTAAFFGP